MVKVSLQKHLHTADGELLLHLDMALEKGEFVSLYGPSGAGKTSILRMLAGFMQPDRGSVSVEGALWFDSSRKINVRPQRRNAGMVFQDYALFPNMTVQENIAFALKKNESTGIVDELLEVTGLTKLALRKPQALSGGQKQRVALARAIAQRPKLLLLDEPLSAIDRELRLSLQETLQEVHRKYHLTTIMVSHDVEEIVKLSDKVIHIANGGGVEYASPAAFFDLRKGNMAEVQQGNVVDAYQGNMSDVLQENMSDIHKGNVVNAHQEIMSDIHQGNVVDVRKEGNQTYVTVLVENSGLNVGDKVTFERE
ncbi:ABC transporter ATP-binding protein [[Flexibacter] sp. ATCC 35208]|uniref:ABC transporter ATP-binding protein n=1 Tax=[Flexibacter] sp. ATCC 35208 TaxID=1936242 RepID=UPI0009CF4EB9|nr:ABC transporter ATP-binding protein [[Flexibacter] sp. ATCC 35208]OMP75654.1 hypothetical protein BW716_29000 [[Flexibacter] sp. ATCC 35208]